MRLITLIVWLLVISTGSGIFAQDAGFPQYVSPKLQADVAALTTTESGYFSLELKSARLLPEQWLRQNSQAIGLAPEMSLRLTNSATGTDRRRYLRYTQHLAGAPVLGGDLVLQTTPQGNLRKLSGFLFPETLFSFPAGAASGLPGNVPDDELEVAARQALLNEYPFALQWNITDHGDAWSAATPWHPSPQSPLRRCRVLEVSEPAGSQAEMVYVDLRTGKVVFRHPLHCSLQRQLHHRNTATANIVWREGDAFPGSLNAEDQEMIKSTEETFSLYYRTFGREGHDGEGGRMRSVNQASISGCPNARAFNFTILACEGVVGDDIVGHEWTHNYINAMSGLLLSFESGAIHEGMADIFGEAIDLLNNRGLDTNDEQHRQGCFTDNYRWSIAEDATAIDTILRDIWAPNCKTDPERRYSNLFVCNSPTGPDIHSNSTVVSRTFALLVDGDTTTTPAVRGIGLTKALHIFYHAKANYLTRVTDFSALATMLTASAQDLQGINLPALTLVNTVAPLSNDSITEADLASLDSAIAVTQLALPSQCPSIPVLGQDAPEQCAGTEFAFVPVFQEDWEGQTPGWTLAENPVIPEDWTTRPWRLTTTPLPEGRSGRAMFAPNAHVGNCNSDRENGTVTLTSPAITLPDLADDFLLEFTHYFSIEPGTDGGLVSYRLTGDESFTPIPRSAFQYNPYNLLLDPPVLNDNPIAGQYAFSGADDLSTTGTWGKSIVDLSSLGLTGGSEFELRWTLGQDGCDGWLGWYVDDIKVGFCGDRALPVSYLSLAATPDKDHVTLSWATSLESNNAGFFVERTSSTDFQTIGFLPPNPEGQYAFDDEEVRAGLTYLYRLRQTDLDGTEQYSEVVSATVPTATALDLYPNPAPGRFTISASGSEASIYDISGKLIKHKILRGGQTAVDGLRPGIYLVRVGRAVRRVVIH